MRVYVGSVPKNIEVSPVINETFDETLDTATIVLQAEVNATPYAPMTPVYFYFDNVANDVLKFYVVSDTIELFSRNPLRYKHTLSLIQNTRMLSKHTVRNSVFSQPPSKYKEGFIGSYFTLSEATPEGSTNYATLEKLGNSNELSRAEKLTIDAKEKVKDTYIQIDVQVGVKPQEDDGRATIQTPKTLTELNSYLTNSVKIDHLYLHYTLDGSDYRTQLTLSDVGGTWLFNQKIKCDEIKNKINLGATNIYICSHDDGTYIDKCLFTNNVSGKFYPDDGITPAFFIIQFRVIAETYYHTVYDVLDLLIKRQRQETDLYKKDTLFTLPDSGDLYDLLTTTIAPNFTFTQCTMFDCLSEIFKLFDATFKLDINNELGIEYLNDYKTSTPNTDYSSLSISIAEDKYNNGFITYYQDARTIEKFPARNNQYAKVRSADLGVPSATDHVFMTPHSIYDVIKFNIYANITMPRRYPSGVTIWDITGNISIDMTRNIQPQNIWSLLSVDSTYDNVSLKQNNTLYFTPGDNIIQLAGEHKNVIGLTFYSFLNAVDYSLYRMGNFNNAWNGSSDVPRVNDIESSSVPNWNNIYLSLQYQTTIDGKAEVQSYTNKYDGDTYVNQDNGAVDLNKLGLNILGLSFKLGEPTRTATKKIISWDDRIKKGSYITIDGNRWVANICSFTLFNDGIVENIEFVKNYNALAQRTRLLREKRFSNISQNLIQKSEDIFIEYIYFTTSSTSETHDDVLMNKAKMHDYLIQGTFDNSSYSINFGVIDLPIYSLLNQNGYVPLVKYGFGNCICFELSLDSPISIGNKTEYTTGWWGSTNYFTRAVSYADSNGFKDTANIRLVTGDDNTTINMPLVYEALEGDTLVEFDNLVLYKQPNEIFALNYEVCFLPMNKDVDFLGSAFINNNNAVSDNIRNKEFYIYFTTSSNPFQYSLLDTKGEGNRTKITNVISVLYVTQFTHAPIADVKTWAICDGDGNIYFASNNGNNGDSTHKTIRFVYKHTRL